MQTRLRRIKLNIWLYVNVDETCIRKLRIGHWSYRIYKCLLRFDVRRKKEKKKKKNIESEGHISTIGLSRKNDIFRFLDLRWDTKVGTISEWKRFSGSDIGKSICRDPSIRVHDIRTNTYYRDTHEKKKTTH